MENLKDGNIMNIETKLSLSFQERLDFFLKKKITDKPNIIDLEYPSKLYLLKIEPKTY